MKKDLLNIVQGKEILPSEVGIKNGGAFLGIQDVKEERTLFANPFGSYSEKSLTVIIEQQFNNDQKIDLPEAIDIICNIQIQLENDLKIKGTLISTYKSLKGYSIEEITDQVSGLRDFVDGLRFDTDKLLGAMLDFEGSANRFFKSNKVIKRFGIIESGNLGLYDAFLLKYSAILALAAKNGNEFSLVIKESSENFLSHFIIKMIPEPIRSVFSRITWRSDVAWDFHLIDKLIDSLGGAIYFGKKSTLNAFKSKLTRSTTNHFFYYDHFPIMIVTEEADDELLKVAAKKAVQLAYRSKGEACLSLQDVFIHEKKYNPFLIYLKDEIRKVSAKDSKVPLSQYSSEFLYDIKNLRNKLSDSGATVSGQVNFESNTMDILLCYDLDINDPILSTENGGPFLAVAKYSNPNELVLSINSHLTKKYCEGPKDKHIYTMLIGSAVKTISEYCKNNSYRVFEANSATIVNQFVSYKPGIPHCGSLSFLADMFGMKHLLTYYEDKE